MVEKIYEIEIKSTPNKIWFALWEDYCYRQWTSVFCPGSYYEGELKEGEQILFLAPNGEGMFSKVQTVVENEKMHFVHLGELKDKQPKVDFDAAPWNASREHYDIIPSDGGICVLRATVDVVDEYIDFMDKSFALGLQKVRDLSENFYIYNKIESEAPIEALWDSYTNPDKITNWNFANDDWRCPWAKVDLREGGSFSSRMEAKDGSFGFEFGGIYQKIETNKLLEYIMEDGRTVEVNFSRREGISEVIQKFMPENENSYYLQRDGWQAILNNFKKYTESLQ